MKHTPKTHMPARSSMPMVTHHESSKWCALSGHTAHVRPHVLHASHRRASGHMRSQALTHGKDRCGTRLTATACISFICYHVMRVGVRPDRRMSSTKNYRYQIYARALHQAYDSLDWILIIERERVNFKDFYIGRTRTRRWVEDYLYRTQPLEHGSIFGIIT
jgi:hypothetical protein